LWYLSLVHRVLGIRLSDEERSLVERAMRLETRLGDRGGSAAWARRVILREAERVGRGRGEPVVERVGERPVSSDDLVAELGAIIGRARVPLDERDDDPPPPSAPIAWNLGQRAAIERVAAWRADPSAPRVLALTGAAGTGKTTVLSEICRRLRGTRVAWSAMTGKAASRMREASGVRGRTLHSVLYQPPREVDDAVNRRIDLEFEELRGGDDSCLLVVDEASMISPRIRADIERSSYDKILLVGDPYQIPPVLSKAEEREQGGADYSVFSDVERAHLYEVMRTSGAALRAATRVRERQEVPTESDGGDDDGDGAYEYVGAATPDVAIELALRAWLADPDDHALVTWRNEVRMLACRVIRAKLGHVTDLPEPGEPLVVRRNVYGTELMNGDAVRVEKWLDAGPTLVNVPTRWARVRGIGPAVELLVPTVRFDGGLPYVGLREWRDAIGAAEVPDPVPLTWAYCLTAHLAQGSEWRRVTTFLPGDSSNPHFRKMTRLPDGGSMMFGMRFLYTALSRARARTSLIVG
jgi:hypothetical protein